MPDPVSDELKASQIFFLILYPSNKIYLISEKLDILNFEISRFFLSYYFMPNIFCQHLHLLLILISRAVLHLHPCQFPFFNRQVHKSELF